MPSVALHRSSVALRPVPVEAARKEARPAERIDRLPAVDAGRILATFAIVWVHNLEGQNGTNAVGALCRFGTSFYILVGALFVVQSALRAPERGFVDDLRSRARRLLRPFLVWSAVYATYYIAMAAPEGISWSALTFWWGPVAGTAVHLWFLPFVFFWGVLSARAVPRLLELPRPVLYIGGLVLAVAVYAFCFRWLHFAVSRPWLWKFHLHRLDRWIVEIPLFVSATLFVVGYYRLKESAKATLHRMAVSIACISVAGFLAMEAIYAINVEAIRAATATEGRFMAHAAGGLLLCALLSVNGSKAVRLLAPLGRYTYLVFLSHILFVELFRIIDQDVPGYGTVTFSLLTAMVIFLVSLGFSWCIQNYRPLRFLRA